MAKPILNVQRQSIPTVSDAYSNLLGIKDDSHFINISLSQLDEIDDQPFPINEDKVTQIAESINNVGVLEPLIVVPNGERYNILSGRHRFRACKLLDKQDIPCYVKNVSDDIARYIILATNTDRNNEYKPSVYARAYAEQKELMKKLGKKTVSSIAEKNGMNSKQIYRYIRLTYLVDEFTEWVDNEKIAFLTGVELSYLTDEQQRVIVDFMSNNSIPEKALTLETAQRLHKAADKNGDTQSFEDNFENIFYNRSVETNKENPTEKKNIETEQETIPDEDFSDEDDTDSVNNTDYEPGYESDSEELSDNENPDEDDTVREAKQAETVRKTDKKDDFEETVKGYMILALKSFGIPDDEISESQLDYILVNNNKKQAVEVYRKGV
ncbi:MAG: ParB/RepB/Spo0J family partition protein [Clostridia bacterium]|nr:ParB/RepB/Spo0J family partition protein [Clostridia bacterium]